MGLFVASMLQNLKKYAKQCEPNVRKKNTTKNTTITNLLVALQLQIVFRLPSNADLVLAVVLNMGGGLRTVSNIS